MFALKSGGGGVVRKDYSNILLPVVFSSNKHPETHKIKHIIIPVGNTNV